MTSQEVPTPVDCHSTVSRLFSAMRQILVTTPAPVSSAAAASASRSTSSTWRPTTTPLEILALDEAVSRLEEVSPDVAAVVRLRFYAGLSVEETAEALGGSPRTVKREWTYARARLFRELSCDDR
jgi:DNA-directed RNA polymerase specialized sigma24 family protein